MAKQRTLNGEVAGQSVEVMKGGVIFDRYLVTLLVLATGLIFAVQPGNRDVSADVKTLLANLLEISFNLGYYNV